jgi:hypothetical protein
MSRPPAIGMTSVASVAKTSATKANTTTLL